MHPGAIPDEIFIGHPGDEERWFVEWVAAEAWGCARRYGETDFEKRTIRLDERLRLDPSKLREIWLHEVTHAAVSYIERPTAFTDRVEEKVVTRLSPILAYALAQGGS